MPLWLQSILQQQQGKSLLVSSNGVFRFKIHFIRFKTFHLDVGNLCMTLSVQMWMGQVMVWSFLLQGNTSLFSRERGNKKERNFFTTFLTLARLTPKTTATRPLFRLGYSKDTWFYVQNSKDMLKWFEVKKTVIERYYKTSLGSKLKQNS